MDLPLLSALQSMKRIEDDPSNEFQTEDLDLAAFAPTHSTVIVVDQKAERTGPIISCFGRHFLRVTRKSPKRLEFVSNSWSQAVLFAAGGFVAGKIKGCTLILKEGLYIDGMGCQISELYPGALAGFALEIVGGKDVRLLFTKSLGTSFFHVSSIEFTLRNVRIYERCDDASHGKILFDFQGGAKCNLIGVKIHSLNSKHVQVRGERTAVTTSRCTLNGKANRVGLFSVAEGGELRADDCLIYEIEATNLFNLSGYVKDVRSSVILKKTRFINTSPIAITHGSRCLIIDCRLEGCGNSSLAMTVGKGAYVGCLRSSFRDFLRIFSASDVETSASVCQCEINECEGVVNVDGNANVSIVENSINTSLLLDIKSHVKGEVEVRRNVFGPSIRPLIMMDSVSKKPIHDVKDAVFQILEVPRASDKERSDYTRRVREVVMERRAQAGSEEMIACLSTLFTDPYLRGGYLYKQCEYCNDNENMDALVCGDASGLTQKFQYCENCREVCYCSAKCQKAAWPDHKLVCGGKTKGSEAKSTSKAKGKSHAT